MCTPSFFSKIAWEYLKIFRKKKELNDKIAETVEQEEVIAEKDVVIAEKEAEMNGAVCSR